jgi:hypothetical protein
VIAQDPAPIVPAAVLERARKVNGLYDPIRRLVESHDRLWAAYQAQQSDAVRGAIRRQHLQVEAYLEGIE